MRWRSAVADELGVPFDKIAEALKLFTGAKRALIGNTMMAASRCG